MASFGEIWSLGERGVLHLVERAEELVGRHGSFAEAVEVLEVLFESGSGDADVSLDAFEGLHGVDVEVGHVRVVGRLAGGSAARTDAHRVSPWPACPGRAC